ncbi:MAG: cupin domain-containing protein [Anaerolineae bacterium]|nr:cupin domain-containing protein [Anaerolineae bacterium]
MDPNPPNVGERIHTLRQQRGLSLRALAARCDLSANAISLIERGKTSPSIATLHALAMALQVPITAFFEETNPQAEVVVSRAGERARSGDANVVLESLGAGLRDSVLEPFEVTLEPSAGSGAEIMGHEGYELVYGLEGEVEYQIAGITYRLAAGDSLLFRARLPHRWRNPTDHRARFLLVFGACQDSQTLQQHLSTQA